MSLCPNCRVVGLIDGSCPDCGAITRGDEPPPPVGPDGKREIPPHVRGHLQRARAATAQAEQRINELLKSGPHNPRKAS